MKKTLPAGIADFSKLIQNEYYYVDKTPLIEEIIQNGTEVILFTRPRRFGKTLNMSMLQYFWDIENAEENRKLFQGLYIETSPSFSDQGKYPVIFLSLKDIKERSWEECFSQLKILLKNIYNQFEYIRSELNPSEVQEFDHIWLKKEEGDYRNALKNISEYLQKYYRKKAIILIDEYDTPILSSYEHGYYEEAITFFRNFYSSALKDNAYLQVGVMTGILRVAKEGIFSGLNNLAVYGILDEKYSQYFGLTEEEVEEALCYYDLSDHLQEVKEWYDGYLFGNTEIYNPWSILNFLSNEKLESYWINTSDNFLIKKILNYHDDILIEELRELFNHQFLEKSIDKTLNMVDLNNRRELWQLLLFSGYLTIAKKTETTADSYLLKIVNKEVHNFFKKTFIDNYLADESLFAKMMLSFLEKDVERFAQYLQRILLISFSYYDGAKEEKFYHNLILGMILYLDRRYQVYSNKEIGFGRYDIVLEPKRAKDTAYILEFKVAKTREELAEKAKEALEQIEEQNYDVALQEKGYPILHIGMAFYGKEVKVEYKS